MIYRCQFCGKRFWFTAQCNAHEYQEHVRRFSVQKDISKGTPPVTDEEFEGMMMATASALYRKRYRYHPSADRSVFAALRQ